MTALLLLLAAALPLSPVAATEPASFPRWVAPEFRLNIWPTVWDPVGQQLLLFRQPASADPIQVWAFHRDDSPQWKPLSIADFVPTFLVASMTAVYDPAEHRVLVVAASSWSVAGQTEVWSLEPGPPAFWQRIEVTDSAPDARLRPSVSLLPGARLLLFGGHSAPVPGVPGGPQLRNDTWVLNLDSPASWTLLVPPAPLPPPRRGGSMAVDPNTRQAILLGSEFEVSFTNEAWAFSLDDTTWSPLHPEGDAPTNAFPHALVFDARRSGFIAVTSGAELIRTDLLTLAPSPRWQALPIAQAPKRRSQGRAHLDDSHDRLILAGGLGPNAESLDQVWAASIDGVSTWQNWTPESGHPLARSGHAGAWVEPLRAVAYLGGTVARSLPGSSPITDSKMWLLSPGGTTPRWSIPALPDLPDLGERSSPGLVHDERRNRLIALVALDPVVSTCWPCDRVWSYDLERQTGWKEVEIGGAPPDIRLIGAFYDRRGDRVLTVSQRAEGQLEVWALSLEAPVQWSRLDVGLASPSPRSSSRVVFDDLGDRIVLYGGFSATTGWRLTDTWTFDVGGTLRWSEVRTLGDPPALPQVACFDPLRNRLLVLASLPSLFAPGVFELVLGPDPTWRLLHPADGPDRAILYAPALYDPRGDRVVIFGGSQPTGDSPASTDLLWYLELGSPIVDVDLALNAGARNHLDQPVGRARIHVAILSSPTFDAHSVDPASVLFEGAPAIAFPGAGERASLERDVNGDGLPDLSLQFSSDQIDGDRSALATLTGRTLDGRRIEGTSRWAGVQGRLRAEAREADRVPGIQALTVEPNPAREVLRVRFTPAPEATAHLELFDLGGRRILGVDLTGGDAARGDAQVRIPSGAPNGLYWIRVALPDRILQARFAVVR